MSDEPDLSQLQQDFVDHIFGNGGGIEDAILADGVLTPLQRIGIYRNSSHGILFSHLQAVYNVTQQLVGEAFFTAFCGQYIDRYPPSHYKLTDYGESFAKVLIEHEAIKAKAWIAEVSQLEWARHKAWHGTHDEAHDFSMLAQLTDEQQTQLIFTLPETVTLIASDYDIDAVWRAHPDEGSSDSHELEKINVNNPCQLIIFRMGKQLIQQCLTYQQWLFLEQVKQGKPLTELALLFGEEISQLLATSVGKGWVNKFFY